MFDDDANTGNRCTKWCTVHVLCCCLALFCLCGARVRVRCHRYHRIKALHVCRIPGGGGTHLHFWGVKRGLEWIYYNWGIERRPIEERFFVKKTKVVDVTTSTTLQRCV